MSKVGILHPGSMGTTIGMALQANGHEVLWASAERSEKTRARAESMGMRDVETVANMATEADIIFSIVMGEGVIPVADEVAASGFSGVFVDCNNVDKMQTEMLGKSLIIDRTSYVEAAIDGYPIPHPHPGYTEERKIFFSGESADMAVELVNGEIFDCIALDTSAKERKHQIMAESLKYMQDKIADGEEVPDWVMLGLQNASD